MDKTIKAKWIATLRSGNYEQGTGRLRDIDNRCCCVGVLCDIIDPAGWKRQDQGYSHRGDGLMSFDVLRKVGIVEEGARKIASMNDGTDYRTSNKKHSFPEIADYIDQHF